MAKTQQVLQIEPPFEITFRGPFTDVVTSHLELTNPTDRSVCFKVKTTAPKQYCVRPNSGMIPPQQAVKVAVMLQPFEYNNEEKSKHKFMVQTAYVPEGDTSLENIWKSLLPADMMDSKLRVVFEMPDTKGDTAEKLIKTASPLKQVDSSMEQQLRKVQDDKKRLERTIADMEREQEQLRKSLEMASNRVLHAAGHSGGGTDDIFSKNAVYLAVVAMILGLLLGYIFFGH